MNTPVRFALPNIVNPIHKKDRKHRHEQNRQWRLRPLGYKSGQIFPAKSSYKNKDPFERVKEYVRFLMQKMM